jgi:hypothetical protein
LVKASKANWLDLHFKEDKVLKRRIRWQFLFVV